MKQGKWICYPGDYAVNLAEKVQTRRYQRNFPIGPFWRMDSAWHNVRFFKTFKSEKPQRLHISWEGRISVFFKRPTLHVDDWYSYEFNGDIDLPAGEHYMEIWVYNPSGLPCIKIDGDELISDENFLVGNNQIDMFPAEVCNCGDKTPNTYALPRREVAYVDKFEKNGDTVYDFGKIIFAFVKLKGDGDYKLYFGETLKESLNDTTDIDLLAEKPYFGTYRDNAQEYFCEQVENFSLSGGQSHTSEFSKAFRFLRVSGGEHEIRVMEEYDDKGTVTCFSSQDETLKKIFDISLYTFSMCAREFFLDGAKRDRWLWGGDAYEAQKAEYYYQYNAERIKNSIIAAFGKPPVKRYVNHIMDYTFYVINMVGEYYAASGDIRFLKYIQPIVTEQIEHCLNNIAESGFIRSQRINGVSVDWVFVDWGDLPAKDGDVSLEQILLWKALRVVADIYSALGLDGSKYLNFSNDLALRINKSFWSDEKGAFIFALNDGVPDTTVTCHANAMAVLYGFADEKQKRAILDNFRNDKISLSKTPFMIQFILEMLFSNGEWAKGDEMLRSFWGGMANAGATTFWETYVEGETAETATAMYGRPFGRSQCHIWGAGPLYVIPRFYFGIRAENSGENFVIEPNLQLLKGDCAITVPLKRGELCVSVSSGKITVRSAKENGKLIIDKKVYEIKGGENFVVEF